MSIPRHDAQLLVIITEASIEKALVQAVKRLGAQGYTVTDVRGGGAGGEREGAWEADRTIRFDIVCQATVADAIAGEVMANLVWRDCPSSLPTTTRNLPALYSHTPDAGLAHATRAVILRVWRMMAALSAAALPSDTPP